MFVQGNAGTGKSTLGKYVDAFAQSQGLAVLDVMTTTLAALQLPRGATAHTTFGIPADVNEDADELHSILGFSNSHANFVANANVVQWD